MTNQETDLWAWALRVYADDGISQSLLEFQDRFDLNINIILWCCWCALHDKILQRVEILNAVKMDREWSTHVTVPLRLARRNCRAFDRARQSEGNGNRGSEDLQSFYEAIKAVELQSERHELESLQAIPSLIGLGQREGFSSHEQRGQNARRNIAGYLAEMGTARYEGFSVSLVETFVDMIFKADDDQAVPGKTHA